MKPIAQRLRSTLGAEIAEVAMVLPLVFMLLLGIIWFGRVYNVYSTITQAAQQGAITAARATCATCSGPTGGGWNGTNFANDSTVDAAIFAVLQASRIDPGQIPTNSNPPTTSTLSTCGIPPLSPPLSLPLRCATRNNITICRNALMTPTASNQPIQCGVVVSFQYPFKFYLPFTSLNKRQIILSAQAQSRMEY